MSTHRLASSPHTLSLSGARRPWLRPTGLLASALALGALALAPAQAQVAAKPADSFVESIGVNTHWEYGTYSNYEGLRQKLVESGIRYIRDGSGKVNYAKYNELYTNHGIRTNVLLGRRAGGVLDLSQISPELNDIKTGITTAAITSLEDPNEYDIQRSGDNDTWHTKVQNYTKDVYAKAKADATLKNLPIIGPSFTSPGAYTKVGSLDAWIDFSNVHLYQSFRNPGSTGWGDNGYGSIDWNLTYQARAQSASKPVQATECGYHNDFQPHARKDSNGNIIKDANGNTTYYLNYGLSEEAEGKYTARMFAEFYRKGIARSYKYELLNQGTSSKEDVFGLLRKDLTEKPSFKAVKNLIGVLSDKGAAFTPSSLAYTLTGTTSNVRQLLFQKRNGDFYLMLWLEVPSWETKETFNSANQIIGVVNKDLYPAAQSVSLGLPSSIKTATVYQLDNKADMTSTAATIANSAVALSVSDKVMIVKLTSGTITSVPSTPTTGTFSGVYRLVARHSGKVLDIGGAGMADGVGTVQWTYKGGSNQHWQVTQQSNGSYKLVAQHSGKCLDVNGGNAADGTKVQQWTDNGSPAQRWTIAPAADGYYTLTNVASGKVLDVAGGVSATNDGAKVHQWTANGNTNQQWKLELVSSPAAASAATSSAADQQALSVYPNPIMEASAEPVTMRYVASKAQTARLMVVNAQGITVYSQQVKLRAGLNEVPLPAAQQLRGGVHVVRLSTDSGAFTQRLHVAR